MERMTADQPPHGQPGTPDCPVPRDRLERVLRAGWREATARRQGRGDDELVTPDHAGQQVTGQQPELLHGDSPGAQDGFAPHPELGTQGIEVGGVGLPPGPNHQIPGGLPLLDLLPPDLPQPPAQTIAGHRGGLELGDDQSHPWLARLVVHPDYIQVLGAAAAAMRQAAANVGRAREPMSPRQARRRRQEPPCFDGSDTVSRLRPFFRRRERTARPQRVAMRARNPCLVIRRLFRGRYDGFIRGILQSEPGKLAGGEGRGQVERTGKTGRTGRAGERILKIRDRIFPFSILPAFPVIPVFPALSSPD